MTVTGTSVFSLDELELCMDDLAFIWRFGLVAWLWDSDFVVFSNDEIV